MLEFVFVVELRSYYTTEKEVYYRYGNVFRLYVVMFLWRVVKTNVFKNM